MTAGSEQQQHEEADGTWLDNYFPLHRAVFHNDVKQMARLLRNTETNPDAKDTHGNTPLHLACMLGNREAVKLLLAHGADMSQKNNAGWKPLHEAISYGDRMIIELILVAKKKASHQDLVTRLPHLREHLAQFGDFYMESKWEFASWIPLLSRILPSDTFKIYKRGAKLRVDFTLIDFDDKGSLPSWVRGDVTMLLDLMAPRERQAVLMDNQKGVYQVLRDKNKHLGDELDLLMSSDIVHSHISTRDIHFHRAKTFFNYAKKDRIGEYKADLYHVKGMHLVTKKRREHLSEEDLKRNKEIQQIFSTGKMPNSEDEEEDSNSDQDDQEQEEQDSSNLNTTNSEEEEEEDSLNTSKSTTNSESNTSSANSSTATMTSSEETVTEKDHEKSPYRKSLSPPPSPTLKWSQYLRVPDQLSHLGRPIEVKVNSKEVKGTVAMSPDFPLTLDSVLDILALLEPMNSALGKLREFCSSRMPEGFPVRIEIPIFASIHAKISFQHFQWCQPDEQPFPASLFRIPSHYREDPKRFWQM